jgi:hypothetical protein
MSDPRGTARVPIQQSREPGKNFEMYFSDNPTKLSVDGIAGITGGSAISQLDFFVVTEARPDSDPTYGLRETRQITVRVAIPTPQLLEGLANLVTLLNSQLDTLVKGAHENAEAIAHHADRLRAMNAR